MRISKKDQAFRFQGEADVRLMQIYTQGPDKPDGKAALAVLEYRKYKAEQRHTKILLALTFALLLTAAGQLVVSFSTIIQQSDGSPAQFRQTDENEGSSQVPVPST